MSADEIKAAPPEYRALQDAMLGRDRVPRRAVFDDLRVGQWVAWCDGSDLRGGPVLSVNFDNQRVEVEGDLWVYPHECEAGDVTILRDVPASPVTVRRVDYDALRDGMQRWIRDSNHGALHAAARALIDNATTEETP